MAEEPQGRRGFADIVGPLFSTLLSVEILVQIKEPASFLVLVVKRS